MPMSFYFKNCYLLYNLNIRDHFSEVVVVNEVQGLISPLDRDHPVGP